MYVSTKIKLKKSNYNDCLSTKIEPLEKFPAIQRLGIGPRNNLFYKLTS